SLEGSIKIFYQGEEISKQQRRKKVIPFSEKIKKKQTVVVGAPQPVSVEVDTRPLSVYDEFTRGESS
ncbi:transposase, partial [Cytobacillus firmus DS1]